MFLLANNDANNDDKTPKRKITKTSPGIILAGIDQYTANMGFSETMNAFSGENILAAANSKKY